MIEIELVKLTDELWMGKYLVTQAQWKEVMGNNPSEFQGPNNPVERVSWFDAQEFCRKLSASTGKVFRLPTATEWEWACRAGTTTKYSFGDDLAGLEEYAWVSSNSEGETHPVGEKKPNSCGLYDMYGNVWEWCEDAREMDDEIGHPHLRGGSWDDLRDFASVAFRLNSRPASRSNDVGFRVVLVGPGGAFE